jgi:hypothetical protein
MARTAVAPALSADLHGDRRLRDPERAQQFGQACQQVAAYPVDHETIGRQQAQGAIAFQRLQRSDPGVEVLLGQLAFERTQAARPERRFQRFASREKGAKVYTHHHGPGSICRNGSY